MIGQRVRRPLGATEHLAGAFAFVLFFAFGTKLINAVGAAVYGLSGRGGFEMSGPSWRDGGIYAAALLVSAAIVGVAVVVFDRWSVGSRYRAWIAPAIVWFGFTFFAWLTGESRGRHAVSPSAALAIGVTIALPFSVWWFVALGVARLRDRKTSLVPPGL